LEKIVPIGQLANIIPLSKNYLKNNGNIFRKDGFKRIPIKKQKVIFYLAIIYFFQAM